MDFVRQWTVFVCITVLICVVLSFLTPNGNMGRFYRMIISVFIFLSFLYPFTQADISFKPVQIKEYNTNSIYDDYVESQISELLNSNSVIGADILCTSSINKNNEIVLEDVVVAVSDEYDVKDVDALIFDNLGIRARVVHIGQ